jgi:hypothetical protein
MAGALSLLALGAGTTAFGQNAPDQQQQISDLQKQSAELQKQNADLQKKIEMLDAKLNEIQGQPTVSSPGLESRLDGATRASAAEALREPRRLNISAPGLEGLDVTGMMHTRGEYWGNYNFGAGEMDGFEVGTEVSLGFNAKISEHSNVYLEPHGSFVWGDDLAYPLGGPTGTSTGTTTGSNVGVGSSSDLVTMDQAYLHVNDAWQGWNVTAGRQRIELGEERMLGDDEWNLNRTSFDGVRLDRQLGSRMGNMSVIAVRLQSQHTSTASLHPFNVGQDDHADLYSLYYTNKDDRIGTYDVYLFHLEDPNYNDAIPNNRTRWTTYGARWVSRAFGPVTFDTEAATQFGEFNGLKTHNWGGSVWAMHAGATFKPTGLSGHVAEHDPSFVAAYDYASGGSDTSDQNTFVQLYPSLHGWFGMTDYFSWSNIEHWMLGVNAKAPHGTIGLSYHWNRLANKNTSATTGAAFQGYNNFGGSGSKASGKELGQELDVVYSANCTKSTVVDTGLGYFMPGHAYTSLTGVTNDAVFAFIQFRTHF